MAESRFVYVTYIRTTPEKLWQALIDAEFTRQYWCETWQECAWKVGATWKLLAPGGQLADSGEVLECDPPRRLQLTWQNHLFADAHAEGHSRLTYELEPQEGAVKLTVTHEMARPESKLIDKVSQGWPAILASLKSLLETGAPLEATRYWPKDFKR
jgi:uncharacterized protein YndB with AHSA1/START domain